MNALLLMLVLTSTIVLHSGDRIVAEGEIAESKGVVTFRSGGRLYSMPASEIVRIEKGEKTNGEESKVRRLAVSDEKRRELLEALSRSRAANAAPTAGPATDLPKPTRQEVVEQRREENQWRREARAHEEAIVRAKEELALLETRVEELRSQIHGFVALGYKPSQFTYQSTMLERTLAQIPYAKLEVTRAERAYTEFREDARRQGVMPGWLR